MKKRVLILVFLLMAVPIYLPSLYAQKEQTDTLLIYLDRNHQLWPYELHYKPEFPDFPQAILPINLAPGKRIRETKLIDIQAIPVEGSMENRVVNDEFEVVLQTFDHRREVLNRILVHPFRLKNGALEQMITARVVIYLDSIDEDFAAEASIFASNSVLSKGRWLKVAVFKSGVYRISPDQLAAAGWNPAQIDPRRLALFGNGGMMLPERNNVFRHDDLVENPVIVTGESDGSFDAGDAIYFYGQSTTSWSYNQMTIRYDHRINYYSDTTYYFLTELERPGLRMETKPQATDNPNTVADIFLDYDLHENDLENLIHSGREWYGEYFTRQKDRFDIGFYFPNRVLQRPVMINTQFAVRSLTETTAFSIELNGETALAQQSFLPIASGAAAFAREQSYNLSISFISAPYDSLKFSVRYHAAEDNSRGWINFLRVNAWRQLKFVPGRQMPFRNPEAVGFNVVAQYRIGQAMPGLWLWDVTNPLKAMKQNFDIQNDMIRYNVSGDSIREYLLFDPADAFSPAAIVTLPNQNLHATQAADMIIVAPPQFLQHAGTMAALHLQYDGLESAVVNINEVFNEFGSGKPDVTALRDFIRMVYTRSGDRLRYVLLFGDASYDYKDRIPNKTNIIPTYQSTQSIIETQSFVSDDYFGLMGSTEGLDMQGVLDLGIGRFPVSTPEEAGLMVAKNVHYLSNADSLRGSWQNNITFMADDKDGNLHLSQAETLASDVDLAYKQFNINKIYLDAYRRIAVPGGFRYPDASAALLKSLHEGSLIVNYTGHGGVSGLTDENVFTITEIEGLSNRNRLAFFVTATCEFSRFDNPSLVSAGERLLLNPNGGAIALMTTTRLAFAHSNFNVNRRLYASLMAEGKSDINRLGDIIRLSKNPTNAYIYNFVLLGNPALRLSYPEHHIEIVSINGQVSDTLHAMSEVMLEGRITKASGQLVADFNGVVQVLMFDKKTTYRTLGNDAMSVPANFSLHDKLIFKGAATVKNGRFSIRFLLPRSISLYYGKPRISLFASDSSNGITAGGYFDNMVLGGIDPTVSPDESGPEIQLRVDDLNFKDGGVLPSDVSFNAHITDPQGIHYLGTEIGRDIVATHFLPDGTTQKYVLNKYFVPEIDNFAAGDLRFALNGLLPGIHHLTLRVWDLHNNSAEKTIKFRVDPSENLKVSNVRVQPNPVADEAIFIFEHNKPGRKLLITLEVYDALGNRVYLRKHEMKPAGSLSEPLIWRSNETAGGRLPSGVYLWRLIFLPEEGMSQTVSGKMILKSS